MSALAELSARSLAREIRNRKISSAEATKAAIDRLSACHDLTHCTVTLEADAAIAAGLDLSPRTVHTHMVNIRRKLGVDRRTEAAARATATATVIPGPATAPVAELARIYRDSFP